MLTKLEMKKKKREKKIRCRESTSQSRRRNTKSCRGGLDFHFHHRRSHRYIFPSLSRARARSLSSGRDCFFLPLRAFTRTVSRPRSQGREFTPLTGRPPGTGKHPYPHLAAVYSDPGLHVGRKGSRPRSSALRNTRRSRETGG